MNSSTEDDYGTALKAFVYNGFLPHDTYVEDIKDIPLLYPTSLLVILGISVLEGVVTHLLGKGKQFTLDFTVANLLCGVFFLAFHMFIFRGAELLVYIWCYKNMRILYLPWNAYYTYVIALLGVDFLTYWWHRLAHEIAVLWASHATHHNGEEFNMSVSVRLASFARFTKWMHFVPLGVLGVPPSIYVMHSQLNFMYAASCHSFIFPKLTKVIPGPGHLIEFIFATPSNHRVHHGVNKFCIDKNYGFVFIIWDRMFGTYVEEPDDGDITYGVTTQLDTFHAIGFQVKTYEELFQKMQTMKTTGDKLRTLFYGPGWSPGKPRLGDEDDIPDVVGREKVKLSIPMWVRLYVVLQTVFLIVIVKEMALRVKTYGPWVSLLNFCLAVSSCTSISGIHDSQSYAVWLEPLRLISLVVASHFYSLLSSHFLTTFVSAFCLGSLLFWPFLNHHFDTLHLRTTSAPNAAEEQKTK